MKKGKFAAAEGVKLHLSAVEQYIEELEKDKEALIEALKIKQVEGLCTLCEHEPKVKQCAEADYDCAACSFVCRCRTCSTQYEHFHWKGRGK